jgi:hypothetical protein
MRIHVEVLHQRHAIRHLLRENGWRLDKENKGFAAEHPAVHDQAAARKNLQALGLLTSAAVRIEFGPSLTSSASGARSAEGRRGR